MAARADAGPSNIVLDWDDQVVPALRRRESLRDHLKDWELPAASIYDSDVANIDRTRIRVCLPYA